MGLAMLRLSTSTTPRTPQAPTSFWYNGMMPTEAQSLWIYSQAGGMLPVSIVRLTYPQGRATTACLPSHHSRPLRVFNNSGYVACRSESYCDLTLTDPVCDYDSVAPVGSLSFTVQDNVQVKAVAYKILYDCDGGQCSYTS